MTDSIEIVDYIMGSGKTSKIIEWMLNNPENKYLFVSPLLTEVEDRIPQEAKDLDFVTPNTETYGSKKQHLYHLLKDGRNICFTHKLYSDMDSSCLALIKQHGYTLILDEEVNFIQAMEGYTRSDISSLIQAGHISVDDADLGRVTWHWDIEAGHKFSRLKSLCDMGCIYSCRRDSETVTVHLPIELITSCKRVILLTYGFTGGVLERFLTLKKVNIIHCNEINLAERDREIRNNITKRLVLSKPDGHKKIAHYSLSWTWWTKDSTLEQRQTVLKTVSSFGQKVARLSGNKVTKDSLFYTIPKSVAERSSCRVVRFPFEECFVSRSIRATNIYQHKWVLCHLYNRRSNTAIKAYLQDYLLSPDDDSFALYEMLQWIWRSRIRDNSDRPVYLYVASSRMERLLNDWLNNL